MNSLDNPRKTVDNPLKRQLLCVGLKGKVDPQVKQLQQKYEGLFLSDHITSKNHYAHFFTQLGADVALGNRGELW